MFESFTQTLYQIDINLFYWLFQGFYHPPIVEMIMPYFNIIGTVYFLAPIFIILLFFGNDKTKKVSLLCLVALVLCYLSSEILKWGVARPRPYEFLPNITPAYFPGGYAFPSGHATNIFAVSTILGIKLGYMVIFLVLAILVAVSRIYQGVHYPSDIIFGALLGIIIALIVLRLEDNFWLFFLKLKKELVHR
jgi:undecaprenyl-diphosphatase